MINNDTRKDTLTGLLIELSASIMRKSECKLPCVVIKVSDDRRRVSVRPLIRIVAQDETTLQREVIDGVPVYQSGAGDLVLSFPVKIGDIGWIESNDRDISLFKQSYEESDPPTRRMHSFSDSVFVPDLMTNFQIAGEDAAAVVLQNRDGSIKIAVDQSEIRIVNDSVRVVIDGDAVTGTAPGGFFLNGAEITPSGDVVTAAGVSLNNHPHDQASDSGGNSEQPTNPPTPTE